MSQTEVLLTLLYRQHGYHGMVYHVACNLLVTKAVLHLFQDITIAFLVRGAQ